MRCRYHLTAVFLLVGSTLLPGAALSAGRAAKVIGGEVHTCALTPQGGVKCWGANASGQLGDGTAIDRSTPTDVSGLTSGVSAVAAGGSHTCAVTTGGGVKCWGGNHAGQLGDGTTTSRITPTDVVGLTSGVAAVATGSNHTCAVTVSGGVKCWGANSSGQLGDGTTTQRATPADVSGLASGVAAVTGGTYHTCALTTGGGVKCWGGNGSGQLGDGTTTQRNTPTDVSGLTGGAASVAAGAYHTCARTTGGGVKCCGLNSSGQIGDGTTTSRQTPTDVSGLAASVLAVALGWSHTCAVTTGGGLKCWGGNDFGALGDDTRTDRWVPTDVSGLTKGAASVAAGAYHACAVTTGGGVRCWGLNRSGQVGDGTRTVRPAPIDVTGLASGVAAMALGWAHSCALTTGGGVKCWGANSSRQLGDGTTAMRTTPTDALGLTSGVASLAAGGYHTCAVTTGGGVKCWGRNDHGQLGQGSVIQLVVPTDVPGLSGVSGLAAGYYHTCALTAGGGVKCWGLNDQGQLGDGTLSERWVPTDVAGLTGGVAAVVAGGSHTCALTTGGGVTCWGQNDWGQLGDGTTSTRVTPTSVSGLTSGVARISAGESQTCALTTGGGVKCWGANSSGELGDGTMIDHWTPTDVSGLTGGVVAISTAGAHGCAVKTGGAVKCWGWNYYGELGDGTTTDRAVPTDVLGLASGAGAVFAGMGHTCVVTTGGGARCWGLGEDGQLGAPDWGPRWAPGRTRGFGQIDFDTDDVADVAVYRPSTGTWFSLDSSTANTTSRYRGWGLQAQGDTPAPGDYDGDGIVDPTVYRPGTGTWFVLESRASFTTWRWFGWGGATDTLMPGDYDGDGVTDAAIYRPSTGQWFVLPSSSGFSSGWAPIVFGNLGQGDLPVAGDFDGDGKRDPAVYRASTGTWFWLKSSASYAQYEWKGWGVQAQGDTPAPGDYDGDGKTDPAVYRPQYGTWFVLTSSSAYTQYAAYGWGAATDTLVPADYDGDGRTDVAIYRPTTGEWWVRPSGGASPWSVVFGQGGDVPLVLR